MDIMITNNVATSIQAVSPLLGTGAGAAAGAAGAAAVQRWERRQLRQRLPEQHLQHKPAQTNHTARH